MSWSRDKVDSTTINGGNEYTLSDNLSIQNLNAMVNSGLYSQDFVEALTDAPDTSEAGNIGTPSVVLIDNIKNGKTYKKFKFSNIKGERGEKGDTGTVGEDFIEITNSGSVTQELFPNTLYHFSGTLTSLTLTFGQGVVGKVNEYMCQVKTGNNMTSINFPSNITWINNFNPNDLASNSTYLFSIVNNIGIGVSV